MTASGVVDAKLQQFFDEASELEKNSSKVVDEEGRPRVMYHGSKGGFGRPNTVNDFNTYIWENDGAGGWFSASESYAASYMGFTEDEQGYPVEVDDKPIQVYLNIRNPFEMGNVERLLTDENGEPTDVLKDYAKRLGVSEEEILRLDRYYECNCSAKELPVYEINRSPKFVELLKSKGYDGAHADEFGNETYMIVDPNQIKSADPETFDDEGNEIPQEERFNPDNEDIRFRELDEEEDADLIAELESGPTITTYSTKVKVDDGYVPPMSSKDNETGKLRTPEHEGKWNEAEERPDLAYRDEKSGRWKFGTTLKTYSLRAALM